MLAEIALAALLDSASVTQTVHDTVYVERTVNPQAAPAVVEQEHGSKAVQYIVGGTAMLAGMYVFFDGINHRDQNVVVDSGGDVTLKKSGWNSKMTVGLATFGFGLVLTVN